MNRTDLARLVIPMLETGDQGLSQVAVLIDKTDTYTYGHAERVAQYALAFGRKMRLDGMQLDRLRIASLLHDLGMLAVPAEIRRKTSELTSEEFDVITNHSEVAAQIVAQVPRLYPVAQVIRFHHEHHDGTGYPDGIEGETIPIEARVLTLVDAFDAMVSNRPFRRAKTLEEALQEIGSCTGSHFNPSLARSFIAYIEERWRHRAEQFGVSTFFAELNIRAYERSVKEVVARTSSPNPQTLADLLQMDYPEIGPEQSRKIVVNLLYEGKLPDDLYSDDVEWLKENEVRVRYPARIDADVGTVLRFSGKLYAVMNVDHLDSGPFEYLLKR